MSSEESFERRSQALEEIRKDLRRQLDKCVLMTSRSSFRISHQVGILLSESEQRAMRRQMEASHGDAFIFKQMEFTTKRQRRKPQIMVIDVELMRRKRALQ